jgi:hypothetical protein
MFMALVQWGLFFHAQSLVDAAAQDANRAVQDAGGTIDDGRSVANQLLAQSSETALLSGATVSIDVTGGDIHTVVRARVRSLVPLPGFDPTVEGVSDGVKERFVAENDR